MENIFKLFLENIPFPIWIKGLDGKFKFVTQEYANIYKKNISDFIGKKNEEIFDKELVKKYNKHFNWVVENKQIKIQEGYLSGEYREFTVFPILNNEKNIIGIGGFVGNINEVKVKDKEIKEQRNIINTIIDTLPGVIFYKDINHKYVYCNEGCKSFYRQKGIENIIGKTDLEINEDKNLAQKFIKDDDYIIKNKEGLYNEAVFNLEDGSKQYREVTKLPALNENDEVMGIVGISRDITAKKEVNNKLKYLSYTDILTGAYNRAFFEEKAIELFKKENFPIGVIMGDANGLKLINDSVGHLEGDKLLKNITNIIKESCKDKGYVCRIGGDEFVILVPNADEKYCEAIIKDILNKCKNKKQDFINISISLGASTTDNINKDIHQTFKEAEDKVYRQKLLQEKSIRSSIMNSLKVGLETKSVETEEHTERLVKNALKIGKKLRLTMAELDELILVAKLHDIGKIGISEEILLKPDKLTIEEYEIMKSHTEKGFRIVQASSELIHVARGVLTHHERWDGNGYPLGLKGQEIPLLSRIVSVVDSYDAMTNDRIYKKAISKKDAINELQKNSGTQFDPDIVKVFIDILNREDRYNFLKIK